MPLRFPSVENHSILLIFHNDSLLLTIGFECLNRWGKTGMTACSQRNKLRQAYWASMRLLWEEKGPWPIHLLIRWPGPLILYMLLQYMKSIKYLISSSVCLYLQVRDLTTSSNDMNEWSITKLLQKKFSIAWWWDRK